jgi:hypothetical protein
MQDDDSVGQVQRDAHDARQAVRAVQVRQCDANRTGNENCSKMCQCDATRLRHQVGTQHKRRKSKFILFQTFGAYRFFWNFLHWPNLNYKENVYYPVCQGSKPGSQPA